MFRVAEIHFEMVPGAVLQDAHIPGAGNRIGKLPDDVEAVFVGEAFSVGLDDGVAALPETRAQGMEGVAAIFGFRSLKVLECVDGFNFGQVVREPLDAGFRFAILDVFEEVGDLVLAVGAIEDGVALDDSDFNFVIAGEQKRFPFFVFAAFNGEFLIGMAGANQLREFLEGRELFVFREDARVIGQLFLLRGRRILPMFKFNSCGRASFYWEMVMEPGSRATS